MQGINHLSYARMVGMLLSNPGCVNTLAIGDPRCWRRDKHWRVPRKLYQLTLRSSLPDVWGALWGRRPLSHQKRSCWSLLGLGTSLAVEKEAVFYVLLRILRRVTLHNHNSRSPGGRIVATSPGPFQLTQSWQAVCKCKKIIFWLICLFISLSIFFAHQIIPCLTFSQKIHWSVQWNRSQYMFISCWL